jgi:hypothetical protein
MTVIGIPPIGPDQSPFQRWWPPAQCLHLPASCASGTRHVRSLGVPCSQYIDDRQFGQLEKPRDGEVLHAHVPTVVNSWTADLLANSTINEGVAHA